MAFLYDGHRLNVAVSRAMGLAIVIVSHYLGMVRRFADRALLLRRIHRENASHRWEVSRSDIFRLLHAAVRRNPPAAPSACRL